MKIVRAGFDWADSACALWNSTAICRVLKENLFFSTSHVASGVMLGFALAPEREDGTFYE